MRRREEGGVRLRSPAHPAHALAVEADAFYDASSDDHEMIYRKLVELIDRGLARSPDDADLIYAKACALAACRT